MADIFISSDLLDDIVSKGDNSNTNIQVPSISTKILDFLNRIEGWKTKCQNLHWASYKKNIHLYLDDFKDVLQEYQDGLAEEEMGIYGRMLPNVLVGTASTAMNAKEFITEVRDNTIAFYSGLPNDSIFAGIRSECETFIHNINKYRYLFSLCDWEFKGGE